jgi:hypothetical protein
LFQETTHKSQLAADVVSADKLGNIVIKIQAKPGAKQNAITGVSRQEHKVHGPQTIVLCVKELSYTMHSLSVIS